MNLVKLVDGSANSFGFICVACREFRDSKHGGWADLDGESFHTFYCKGCGDALNLSDVRQDSQREQEKIEQPTTSRPVS